MTLMVNGTLQSEFLTMFCPMRLMYSVTTGSVMNFVLFSISSAYCLPIRISDSVEYQFPIPRPPMLRVPTALTSSMLPGLTPGIIPSFSGCFCGKGLIFGSLNGLPLAAEASSPPFTGPTEGTLAGAQTSPPLPGARCSTGPEQSSTDCLSAVWGCGAEGGCCCCVLSGDDPMPPPLCAYRQPPESASVAQNKRLRVNFEGFM